MWEFACVSNEEADRQRERYEPLAESVRRLIDATVRTEADDAAVLAARNDIDAIASRLRERQCDGTMGISLTPDGRTFAWGNVAIGIRNPAAPPVLVDYDSTEKVHADVYLGAAYEGAPGHLHGGYSALVLDQVMGDLASHNDPNTVAATGTITYRYRRPTRLGPLHAEAHIDRTEGRKMMVVAHLADADGPTVEAEGIFIRLKH